MILGTDVILTTKAHSNIDALYGPYFIGSKGDNPGNYKLFDDFTSLENYIDKLKSLGLTVGIINEDREVSEYWFLYDEEELKLTTKGLNLKLSSITLERLDPELEDLDTTIRLRYTSRVSSIFGTNALKLYYRKNNGSWILYTLRDFLKSGDTFIIENLETGEYDFRIVLSDIFRESVEYILSNIIIGQYTLEYDITLALTLSVIRTINNLESHNVTIRYKINILREEIQESDFHFFLDDTPLGTHIITNNNWQEVSLNNAFFNEVPSGGLLYIGTSNNKKKLFNILGSNTLNVEVERKPREFFLGEETSVAFIFETGASTMYITTSSDSDFYLLDDIVTLNNFNVNTGKQTQRIWIVPKAVEKDNSKIIFKFDTNIENLNSTANQISVYLGKISELTDLDRILDWPDLQLSNVTSFYLDFSATLHKTSDESDKLLEINNDIYIDNNIIQIGDLQTVTPVEQGDVYIGIGYHLQDSNPNISTTSLYNCICINGVVVAVKQLDYNSAISLTTTLKIEADSNVIFKKKAAVTCKGLWYSGDRTISLVRSGNNTLCETHYKFDFNPENKTLPTLRLEAKHFVSGTTYYTWKGTPIEATFGTLSDGATKYQTKSAFDLSKKLLQMGTAAKSDCLKKYAVLCHYTYDDGNGYTDNGDVLVYTQGTSTLNYPLPNFKLFFLDDKAFDILSEDKTFSERIVTLKADYMESSHLNNTPTAMLFNKAVLKLAEDNEPGNIIFSVSPPVNIMLNTTENPPNYSDAIVGTPIVLEILDIGGNSANYGSFMLNTDKVSDSLGFKCFGDNYRCMSFEGTTNFADGSAARFFYNEVDSKASAESHSGERLISINNLLKQDALINNSDWDDDTKFENLWEANKDGIARYLARGFEFRYPESTDFLDEETETTITSKAEPYLKEFFKMWRQISLLNDLITDENTQQLRDKTDEEKREIISNLFDVDYCKLYIIFLIVFALTDNLGKNCMFDCWEIPEGTGKKWGKWYPRPYDLDSINGLTNGGVEDVPPFAFVSPDWISDITTEFDRFTSHKYKKYNSVIYRYSSENSILWSNIYKLYKTEIREMYLKLRDTIFDTNLLINYYLKSIIDKISIALYNIDFLNKYVASSQMEFMYGNRWTSFKDWITARLSFCDSFFRCNKVDFLGKGSLSEFIFDIKYMFPAFYTKLNERGEEINKYFGKNISDSAPDGAVHYMICLADDLVESNNIFEYNIYDTTFENGKIDWNLISQKSIEINSAIYPNINEMSLLEDLTIGETASLGNYNLIVPNSVKTLTIKSQIQSLTFNEGSNLQECILENINIGSGLQLSFINCENLSLLTLKNVTTPELILENSNLNLIIEGNSIINSLTITGGSYESLILKNQTFSNVNISGNPTIKLLDLFSSTITNKYLDLNSVNYGESFTLNIINSNIEKVRVSQNFSLIPNLLIGVQESRLIGFGLESEENLDFIDLDLFNSDYTINGSVSSRTINSIVYVNLTDYLFLEPIKKIDGQIIIKNNLYILIDSSNSEIELEKSGLCLGLTPITKAKISKGKTIIGLNLFAKCNNLQSIEIKNPTSPEDYAIIDSDFTFYDCNSLLNLNLPSELKLKKFIGTFVGTSINWDKAFDTILDSEDSGKDFRYFYSQVTPTSNTSFDVNFSNLTYVRPENIIGMFYNSLELRFIYGDPRYQTLNGSSISFTRPNKAYKLNIVNLFNSQQTSFEDLFTTNPSGGIRATITIAQNFSDTDVLSNVTDLKRAFYGCNLLIDPIEFVNKTNFSTARGAFAYCNFTGQTYTNNLLPSLAARSGNKINLGGMFSNATFENKLYYIDNFIVNLTNSEITLESCFRNCSTVSVLEELKLSNSFPEAGKVYIGGLLGMDNPSTSTPPMPIFFNSHFEIRSNTLTVATGTYSNNESLYLQYVGPFTNRIINSISLDLSGDNIRYYCKGIKTENGLLTINISNTSDISGICYGANNIRVKVESLKTNCTGIQAFYNTVFHTNLSFDSSTFSLLNLIDAGEMFSKSSISRIEFTLPSTLTNVKHMFDGCQNLKDGLPSEFFNNNNIISDISFMFRKTQISRIKDTTGRNITIPSNIRVAVSTFALTRCRGNSLSYNITIDSSLLRTITGIFASSWIPISNILINNIGNSLAAEYAFVNVEKSQTIWNSIKGKLRTTRGLWAWEDSYLEAPYSDIPTSDPTMFSNWLGCTPPNGFSIPGEYKKDSENDWINYT